MIYGNAADREGAKREPRTFNARRNLALVALAAALVEAAASAEVVDADWADPNFAFCEDLGVHASGRVRATAKVENVARARRITSLSITTTHGHAHRATGAIVWKSPNGEERSTTLQEPWFDVISAPGAGQLLVLPRNGNGPGPFAQTPIETAPKSPITIKLNLLFTTPGGNCPTSFTQAWTLP